MIRWVHDGESVRTIPHNIVRIICYVLIHVNEATHWIATHPTAKAPNFIQPVAAVAVAYSKQRGQGQRKDCIIEVPHMTSRVYLLIPVFFSL